MEGIENNRKVLGMGFFEDVGGRGRPQCVCNRGFVSCVTMEKKKSFLIWSLLWKPSCVHNTFLI